MIEIKLRDVIVGALNDSRSFDPLDPNAAADNVATVIMRRLQHAQSIEFDDMTTFVRRSPVTREARDHYLRTVADMMAAYGQRHVAIALIEAVGHA